MMKSTLSPGSLYIVATPIGNFADISSQQVKVLSDVDVVLCERPAHSARLFKYMGIQPKQVAKLTDHDKPNVLLRWIELIQAGQSIACISDAGTPMISDPGALLVRLAHEHAVKLVAVPGPSAVTTAVSISGYAVHGYSFYGFLPAKKSARQKMYASVAEDDKVSVFFESPHRLAASLHDLQLVLGDDRQIMLLKELTKVHETYWRDSIANIVAGLADIVIKGEFVLLLAPVDKKDKSHGFNMDLSAVLTVLKAEGISLQQAVVLAVKLTGESKNTVYKLALQLYAQA